MVDAQKVLEFAVKWRDIFCYSEVNYLDIIDGPMGDECRELGFVMDAGQSFKQLYGKDAFEDYEALCCVIAGVEDIQILGNAIFSRWRYFNHWAYDGAEILQKNNWLWFVVTLECLLALCIKQLPMGKSSRRVKRLFMWKPDQDDFLFEMTNGYFYYVKDSVSDEVLVLDDPNELIKFDPPFIDEGKVQPDILINAINKALTADVSNDSNLFWHTKEEVMKL